MLLCPSICMRAFQQCHGHCFYSILYNICSATFIQGLRWSKYKRHVTVLQKSKCIQHLLILHLIVRRCISLRTGGMRWLWWSTAPCCRSLIIGQVFCLLTVIHFKPITCFHKIIKRGRMCCRCINFIVTTTFPTSLLLWFCVVSISILLLNMCWAVTFWILFYIFIIPCVLLLFIFVKCHMCAIEVIESWLQKITNYCRKPRKIYISTLAIF